jgi:hypothetical protein
MKDFGGANRQNGDLCLSHAPRDFDLQIAVRNAEGGCRGKRLWRVSTTMS